MKKHEMFKIRGFYVAFFSSDAGCYERYSVNFEEFDEAEKFLMSRREVVPTKAWVVLAVIDV
tara:strand:+ start:292 stop:477 length:186 start_codon:yes stop_codon:yes gene_type:complete